MPAPAATIERPPPLACRDDRSAHTLAVMVLAEMRKHGILPTPQNYDLWFTFRTGTNAPLVRRMEQMLGEHASWTPSILAALQDEFLASANGGVPPRADGADALHDLAEDLSDQIAAGEKSLRMYGRALSAMSAQLASDPTVGSLVEVLATMAADTTRASERNRDLERQLATCVNRIDKLKRSLSASKAEAATDLLTGLMNRRALEARLRRALVETRSEPGTIFSVLMMDVDHFKLFNDQHGHSAGDYVLRMLARLLTESVKGRDIVARYGGEEFIVLLPSTPLLSAAVVARQIATLLSEKSLVHRPSQRRIGRITISTGIAQAREGDTLMSLMERADAALYEAKASGRNQVVLEAAEPR